MVFCNVLLVFLVSLQLGSYQMMIDGSLAAYTGHIQVQRRGYHDDQHIYQSVPAVIELASSLRSVPGVGEVAARAEAFALASSAQRSFGILLTGVQPGYEPAVSTFPGKVREGRYLQADEGGVSHFNYLRDNVLLTWMHIRLMVGFGLRLPWLLARRLRAP